MASKGTREKKSTLIEGPFAAMPKRPTVSTMAPKRVNPPTGTAAAATLPVIKASTLALGVNGTK
jgi:hypothetical protein